MNRRTGGRADLPKRSAHRHASVQSFPLEKKLGRVGPESAWVLKYRHIYIPSAPAYCVLSYVSLSFCAVLDFLHLGYVATRLKSSVQNFIVVDRYGVSICTMETDSSQCHVFQFHFRLPREQLDRCFLKNRGRLPYQST